MQAAGYEAILMMQVIELKFAACNLGHQNPQCATQIRYELLTKATGSL